MICSLLVDADDSPDFPGSTATALGRPMAAYPMMAARGSSQIRRHYVVTESVPVKAVAAQNAAVIVDPPTGDSTFESRMIHAVKQIEAELAGEGDKLELLCVFSAQTPTITTDLVEQGVEALLAKPEYDAAVSVSAFNRHNPLLAHREGATGSLEPVVRPYSDIPGDIWFPDFGVQILRPTMLLKGEAPGKALMWWLGAKVMPLKQWGGGPVDYQSQVPGAEFFLKKHGYADISAAYELQPKPQPQNQPRDRRVG